MNKSISNSQSHRRQFSPDFLWGAATCPACCEGETVSDWGKLAAPDGSVPDDGPRHWRRYRYDFKAMADLGLKAYRFGCDWGRLQREPYARLEREDTFRYLEMLAELRSLGIEPWLVLFQNALPRWAAAAGGWLNPETPRWLGDFAHRLADATDGEVVHWLTIHEPQVYALSYYAWGVYPSGSWGRLDQARKALGLLAKGHRLAAAAIRRRLPEARIGVSLPGGYFFPRRTWHPGDWLATWTSDWFFNRAGMGKFVGGGNCDFLMLRAGNELGVGVFDALSLSSGVSAALPGRMRESGGDLNAERRRRRLAGWLNRHRMPIYLSGSIPHPSRSEEFFAMLAAYANSENGRGASGFFYDPLLDQFDLGRGLADGRGLLKVDFHGRDRRRDMRRFARDFGKLARCGYLENGGGKTGANT